MSIQTELSRIINAKASIVAAIEGKGVTVPDGTLLDGMATLIESIQAGGGGGVKIANGSFTPANDAYSYVVTHNLGKPPTIAVFAVYNALNSISQGCKLAGIAYYNDQEKKTQHITVQYKLASAGTSTMFNLSVKTTGYLEELTNPTGMASDCFGIVAYGSTNETITFGNANQSKAKFKSGVKYVWVVVA